MNTNTLTYVVIAVVAIYFIVAYVIPFFKKAAKVSKGLFSSIYLNKNTTVTSEQYKKIALGAIYSEQQTAYIKSLTTGLGNLDKILGDWWGIHDRNEALEVLNYLKDKGFRFYLPVVYKSYTSPESDQNQIIVDNFSDDEDQEKAYSQLENLKETLEELKEGHMITTLTDILSYGTEGWDCGRLVFLARLCFDAKFITEEEAWSYINAASELANSKFQSWEEYSKSYVIGRSMWGGVESGNTGIMVIAKDLLKLPNSPWVQMSW